MLEDQVVEITATKPKKTRIQRNEDNLTDIWDNIKCTNVHMVWVPEGEERESLAENTFEVIIAENILNLGKEAITQV